jgi:hypothetical protein
VTVSGFAGDGVIVPAAISQVSAGAPVVPVWVNGDGGVTFRIDRPGRRQFAKWAPVESPIDLAAEMTRLRWAADFVTVPHVVDYAETTEGTYLLTAELRGDTAITDYWKAHPAQAVQTAGSGLRTLHDSLPVDTCPFDWTATTRPLEPRTSSLSEPEARSSQFRARRRSIGLAPIAAFRRSSRLSPIPLTRAVVGRSSGGSGSRSDHSPRPAGSGPCRPSRSA